MNNCEHVQSITYNTTYSEGTEAETSLADFTSTLRIARNVCNVAGYIEQGILLTEVELLPAMSLFQIEPHQPEKIRPETSRTMVEHSNFCCALKNSTT
ncbi:hypothetical protein TNCV_2873661 [Trichonephila clavipes]|nr:hypothetical protein TNCV_2873661 [Trichonephila clavipes]